MDTIDKYVDTQMRNGDIPGASIIITKGDKTVYNKAFGYADVKEKRATSSETLFELGSTSKSFTGLAILKLEKEGQLSLKDPVEKYIPWLKMRYKGKEVNITIEQLLHHTSGISFKSINEISESESPTALEECVRTLIGQELETLPGERFSYATINYDVLGLIVQKISGQSYEEYMKNNILKPMGLENTYLFREEAAFKDLSKGYKTNFFKAREYDAPMYRGNTPAGYFIINGEDMAKWLKIQLGVNEESPFDKDLIIKSHDSDLTVAPGNDGESYASGWFVNKNRNEIFHSGSNPNFSSSIILKPEEKMAVAILANRNTSFSDEIVMGVLDILEGQEEKSISSDMYKDMDKITTPLFLSVTLFNMIITGLFVLTFIQIRKNKRKFKSHSMKKKIYWTLLGLFILMLEYYLYKAPEMFFGGISWSFVRVWAPESIVMAAVAIGLGFILLYFYLLFTSIFLKTNSHSYFDIS